MSIGLYIHIPFCAAKCAYCDFYSFKADDVLMDAYVTALVSQLERYSGIKADTLYIGGGTPTLLGAKRIEKLLAAVNRMGDFSEATIEANPADDIYDTLSAAAAGGINRLSLGVQTADVDELQLLSRRHKNSDVAKTFETAHRVGIENISADIMLAIPRQTPESLQKTLGFVLNFEPRHISTYLLKLEQGTPLFNARKGIPLPSDDEAAELYMQCCATLQAHGFSHYEVSNFAKDCCISQHNTNYWRCGEYIGVGAAAHGFLNGKRYYYKRDINAFIHGDEPVADGCGGTAEEYLMLGLRLSEGISLGKYSSESGAPKPQLLQFCDMLEKSGLAVFDGDTLALSEQGFLVSNEIITQLLEIK